MSGTRAIDSIREGLAEIPLLDVHTHLDAAHLAARGLDDVLLYHMMVSELSSAGCPSRARLSEDPTARGGQVAARRKRCPSCPSSATRAAAGASGSSCATSTASELPEDDAGWWRARRPHPRALGGSRVEPRDPAPGRHPACLHGALEGSRRVGRRRLPVRARMGLLRTTPERHGRCRRLRARADLVTGRSRAAPARDAWVAAVRRCPARSARWTTSHAAVDHYVATIPYDRIVSTAQHLSTDIDFRAHQRGAHGRGAATPRERGRRGAGRLRQLHPRGLPRGPRATGRAAAAAVLASGPSRCPSRPAATCDRRRSSRWPTWSARHPGVRLPVLPRLRARQPVVLHARAGAAQRLAWRATGGTTSSRASSARSCATGWTCCRSTARSASSATPTASSGPTPRPSSSARQLAEVLAEKVEQGQYSVDEALAVARAGRLRDAPDAERHDARHVVSIAADPACRVEVIDVRRHDATNRERFARATELVEQAYRHVDMERPPIVIQDANYSLAGEEPETSPTTTSPRAPSGDARPPGGKIDAAPRRGTTTTTSRSCSRGTARASSRPRWAAGSSSRPRRSPRSRDRSSRRPEEVAG